MVCGQGWDKPALLTHTQTVTYSETFSHTHTHAHEDAHTLLNYSGLRPHRRAYYYHSYICPTLLYSWTNCRRERSTCSGSSWDFWHSSLVVGCQLRANIQHKISQRHLLSFCVPHREVIIRSSKMFFFFFKVS